MRPAFVLRLTFSSGCHDVGYQTIDECLSDEGLTGALQNGTTTAVLWVGRLRMSGRPISSSAMLREALASAAGTILRSVGE